MSAFRAVNPASGEPLAPDFHASSPAELETATRAAERAFAQWAWASGAARGRLLRTAAAQLEARRPALVERAHLETGLPAARLEGETARTCAQLRMFAALVEEGSWVDARLDAAPGKPSIRSLLRPLGPVAVFGASNFPLAFSVAGGDTASALAAGCPVLVKAHPAHPGTSQLAGEALRAAVAECGAPAGVFALLMDDGVEVGRALVRHPAVKAVGFTGSLTGGRALMDLAAARPEPIPVYAEMGSSNPVFLLPEALAQASESIARDLAASVTLGAGQFCTKPGLVFVQAGQARPFGDQLAAALAATGPFTLLTAGIWRSFQKGVAERAHAAGVDLRTPGGAAAVLLQTDANALDANPGLGDELFGPGTLLVSHANGDELLQAAERLHGHLTVTVHATPADLERHAPLLRVLERKAGRLVFGGYPTGVEVTDAMMHGGPYPASSSRETSVGTAAILRFTRRVCYQNAPEAVLPPELREDNPLKIRRRRNGALE